MEKSPAALLHLIAGFDPKYTRLSCLSKRLAHSLRCGCSQSTRRTAGLALARGKEGALIAAVCSGNARVVRHLACCLPCPPRNYDHMGMGPLQNDAVATPLGHAVLKGSTEVLELLLENQADPNFFPSINLTREVTMSPLITAIQADIKKGTTQLTSKLLKAGARINTWQWKVGHNIGQFGTTMTSLTPLIASLASNDMLQYLIANKADVNGVQYQTVDCLEQHVEASFTPLEYVVHSKWQSANHNPPQDSIFAHAILREHCADVVLHGTAAFAPGDLVEVTCNEPELLQFSRTAGMGTDNDKFRIAAIGRHALVHRVDKRDHTLLIQVLDESAIHSLGPACHWMQENVNIHGVMKWFPMDAVSGKGPLMIKPRDALQSLSHIDVRYTGAPMRIDGKREYNYDLVFRGAIVHHLASNYSNLRNRCKPVFGEFPSRHAFRDFKTNEANVSRRGEEIRSFLQNQLNQLDEGTVVASAQVHVALGITSRESIQTLQRISASRRDVAHAVRAQASVQQAAIDQPT